MAEPGVESNDVLRQLVANSLFTRKQMSIIYTRLDGTGRPPNMTSGAYFRQVAQCKKKVEAVLYSTVVLQSTGVLEQQGLGALSQLAEQMAVILSRDARDILPADRTEGVMSVMSQVIKRLSRL